VQNLELSRKNYLLFGLLGMLTLAIIIAYLIIRQNKLKQQQLRIEFTQKLLRSQINPHFMSNCLSAIQGLMLSGRVSEAAEYQAKFSTFLRQILDSSENFYISLSEELNSIKLYLELEQLRFENNFEFTLNIEPGLPLNELMVPSFITQPFIENAIWHGLLPLQVRTPKLKLGIYTKDKFVFFEIEDNGVGRSGMATKRNKSSKGSRIVMDNINNMNQLMKSNDNSVEIIDLIDEQNIPAGTKVIIRLKRYTLDE
jgi:LytS/YehU family sensor histidine kinase